MKGYIAFCPHFHQPHFQLHRTREEAFQNSYQPWLGLLEKAVNLPGFFINVHFSGPFLYWIKGEKPDYLQKLRQVMESGKVGITGGLLDEPFIQLSSRIDDYLYQLKGYERLIKDIFGVDARDWQAIHLVERECGELVLAELSRSARYINAAPIFYLDAETFFPSHFRYPGSDSDYCLKHFGFNDPVSITTISHLPEDMLHYCFRDELGGEEYLVFPVHSQYRYQLLKRQGFTAGDTSRVSPRHYFFYIKEALEKAYHMVQSFGRNLAPVLVIFEDAEKFGQWSKDPEGDQQWLLEFFNLVEEDSEVEFTGLKDYFQKYGYLDTYPARTSHSYTEWENWTACRGIRGVTFGDERLRRVLSRLRDLENRQEAYEEQVNQGLWEQSCGLLSPEQVEMLQQALRGAPQRYDFVHSLLEKQDPEAGKAYELINRVRHLVYQEDPKWASRHPSYGSSPYYDAQGMAYLEMAIRICDQLHAKAKGPAGEKERLWDWDRDNIKEAVIERLEQTLVIDPKGGCLAYHHVLAPLLPENPPTMVTILQEGIADIRAYHDIHRFAVPLVFTETDSSLVQQFYAEGGRQERCRNSLRCQILLQREQYSRVLGSFETATYQMERFEKQGAEMEVALFRQEEVEIGSSRVPIKIKKVFHVYPGGIRCVVEAECEQQAEGMILKPQLVCSASPSDEIAFQPAAFLGFLDPGAEGTAIQLRELSQLTKTGSIEFQDRYVPGSRPGQIDYHYHIRCGEGSQYSNLVSFKLKSSNPMPAITVEPAVRYYYQDLVFPEQSRLGFHSSGLMLKPELEFVDGRAGLQVDITWEFQTTRTKEDYAKVLDLIVKD